MRQQYAQKRAYSHTATDLLHQASYIVPKAKENHYKIAVSCDSSPSPDIHLFIESADGSTEHFAYTCENGFISADLDLSAGVYHKVCLVDSASASEGKNTSKSMSRSHLTIYIYSADGLDSVLYVPVNSEGVVWEAFEVQNGSLSPIQRYYKDLDVSSWWALTGLASSWSSIYKDYIEGGNLWEMIQSINYENWHETGLFEKVNIILKDLNGNRLPEIIAFNGLTSKLGRDHYHIDRMSENALYEAPGFFPGIFNSSWSVFENTTSTATENTNYYYFYMENDEIRSTLFMRDEWNGQSYDTYIDSDRLYFIYKPATEINTYRLDSIVNDGAWADVLADYLGISPDRLTASDNSGDN